MSLRPSSLPKLAHCAKWQGEPFAGPYAERGNLLDACFRAILDTSPATLQQQADKDQTLAGLTDAEDRAAVEWAVNTCRLFAGEREVITDEAALRVEVLGMKGTADAKCLERQWSADLKTGEIRDYEAQQAAYALGFMDQEFTDTWTVLLLFCDERQVVTLDYTRAEAEALVRGIVARVKDPQAIAEPNEYCSWCAHRWTCKERLAPISQLLFGAPDKLDVERIKADPTMCGAVLSITHEIQKDDGLHDVLKAGALEHVNAGRTVPGFTKVSGKESRTVDSVTVARHAHAFGFQKLCAAYGNMSEAKFLELWNNHFPGKSLPADAVTTKHGLPYLAKARAKKAEADKAPKKKAARS
jgi:hypothetical protein